MSGRRSWLEGVAAVLRATTGDLRELARIAGADPATLYIGTSMNGVDISGQDLRGITFTDLDLAKVKHDDKTLVDAPPNVPASDELPDLPGPLPQALVFFSQQRMVAEFLAARGARALDVGFFEAHDERAFREACATFPGPKFAVLEVNRTEPLYSAISPFDPDVVVLVMRRGGAPSLPQVTPEVADRLGGPVVLVLASGEGGLAYSSALTSTLRHVIALFMTNWSKLLQVLSDQRVSVFLRAKGATPEPLADAWCVLFERLERVGLTRSPGFRLHSAAGGGVPRNVDIVGELLGNLKSILVDRPPLSTPSDVAALVDLYGESDLPPESRDPPTANLMRRLGWGVVDLEHRAPGDIEVTGPSGRFTIETMTEVTQGDREALLSVPIAELNLSEITDIVIARSPDETSVLHGLFQARQARFSIRDIRTWRPDEGTIWTPLRHQLRRLARGRPGPLRTAYLSLFLRAAFQLDQVDGEDPDGLIEALNEPDFAQRYILTFTTQDTRPERTVFVVQITRSEQWAKPVEDENPRFLLHMAADGPSISSLSYRPWRRHR